LPTLASAIVTAGFKCPPLILLVTYTPIKTAIIHPKTMEMSPPLFPFVLGSTTLATTPLPIVMTRAVPKNSAAKGVMLFYFNFKQYIKLRKNSDKIFISKNTFE
jgi:hypothetical protein